jgi:hypothetical protein
MSVMPSHGEQSGEIVDYTQYTSEHVANDLRAKAQMFSTVYDTLLTYRETAAPFPVLATELDNLLSRGQALKNSVIALTSRLEAAKVWLTESAGLSGVGLLPVVYAISASIVAGAIAMITKWISDAYITKQKLDDVQRLIAQGIDPDKAQHMVNSTNYGGLSFSSLFTSQTGKILLIGAAIFFVLPMLTKGRG